MAQNSVDPHEAFIIPARTLRGSRREMVQDIDQAIVGLLALRHLIDGGAPPPEALEPGEGPPSRQRGSWWPRLSMGLRLAGARRQG